MPDNTPDLNWDSCDYEDEHDQQSGWDYLTDALTTFIQAVHPDGDWHAEVENFGWQSRSGHKDFSAGDGETLLRELLPETECTFKVWFDKEEKKITIDNAHHDKPTGGEMYYVTPAEEAA